MSVRISVVWLGVLVLISGCASFDRSRNNYVYQEVFYLTTREDTGRERPADRFNGQRGETARGVAMVAIDPSPVLSEFAVAQPNHILHQDKLLQRRALQQLRDFPEGAFIDAIEAYSEAGKSSHDVLLFIHGYRRSFESTVENAAQLRYQLAFTGPVITFSWPATDSVSGYLANVQNLDWSQPVLENLIQTLVDRLPEMRLHIIAHSLGNRALMKLLTDLLDRGEEAEHYPFGHLVFIAPDVDREVFMRDIAPDLERLPFPKTLYVSAEDFPLMASGTVFQYPRLGDSRGQPPIVDGMETIDVSDAINLFNGHGYYEADRATIEDLYFLIRENLPAAQRPRLIRVDTEAGPYWRLQPIQ